MINEKLQRLNLSMISNLKLLGHELNLNDTNSPKRVIAFSEIVTIGGEVNSITNLKRAITYISSQEYLGIIEDSEQSQSPSKADINEIITEEI